MQKAGNDTVTRARPDSHLPAAGDGMAVLTPTDRTHPHGIVTPRQSQKAAQCRCQRRFGTRRSRDQVMFDLFAQSCSGTSEPIANPVDLVMMTPDTLSARGYPAWLAGTGPSHGIARQWLKKPQSHASKLFATPRVHTSLQWNRKGEPPGNLRKMPFEEITPAGILGEAPILDGDHITPLRGGETHWETPQACGMQSSQREPGWHAKAAPQSLKVITDRSLAKHPAPSAGI